MAKAKAILSIDEVRDALDLSPEELPAEKALELSLYASERILNTTGENFVGDRRCAIARHCAELMAIDSYFHTSEHRESIGLLLQDLQDIARRTEDDDRTA